MMIWSDGNDEDLRIVVVVPAFNEAETIPKSCFRQSNFCSHCRR